MVPIVSSQQIQSDNGNGHLRKTIKSFIQKAHANSTSCKSHRDYCTALVVRTLVAVVEFLYRKCVVSERNYWMIEVMNQCIVLTHRETSEDDMMFKDQIIQVIPLRRFYMGCDRNHCRLRLVFLLDITKCPQVV